MFLITMVAGLALGYVYEVTKEPIAKMQIETVNRAYHSVFTDAVTFTVDEELTKVAAEYDMVGLDPSFNGIIIDEVDKAFDDSNNLVGYVFKVTTNQGYNGTISLAVGYSLDGTVKGIEMVSISETAGLGMNADTPKFKDQFSNKTVERFETTKTDATEEHQIEAISGATITTDAVVHAVNAGVAFINANSTEIGGGTNE
nr:RnfABCDGE type electron transport complex subunit G [Mobilitalea sibirica]